MTSERLPTDSFARNAAMSERMLSGTMQDAADLFVAIADARHLGGFAARAARKLGLAADRGGIDVAVRMLLSEPLPRHANHAAALLGLARAHQALPVLSSVLPHQREQRCCGQVTHEAIAALGVIGTPPATEALCAEASHWIASGGKRACPTCAQLLVQALAKIGTDACRDTVLCLTAAMRELWDQHTLYAVVRIADARFTPFLLELCAGPQRQAGLAGLQRVGTKRAGPALIHILSTAPDRRTRHNAARALATTISSGSSWFGLLDARHNSDTLVRREIAWILGRVRQAHSHPLDDAWVAREIGAWLAEEPDELVRARLAYSTGLGGYAGVWHELLQALDDPSYRVRAAAANALGRLRITEVVEPLRRVAKTDPVACVQDAAAAALRQS